MAGHFVGLFWSCTAVVMPAAVPGSLLQASLWKYCPAKPARQFQQAPMRIPVKNRFKNAKRTQNLRYCYVTWTIAVGMFFGYFGHRKIIGNSLRHCLSFLPYFYSKYMEKNSWKAPSNCSASFWASNFSISF